MSKKSNKGDLRDRARAILDSIRGDGTAVATHAETLQKEPAAVRRDTFEAVREARRSRNEVFEPPVVLELLSPVVAPGANAQAEFAEKYWRGLFACATDLCGERSRDVCASLFMEILAGAVSATDRGAGPKHFEQLALIDHAVLGLEAALGREPHREALAKSTVAWLPMVPELAARARVPLSPESAQVLVAMIEALPAPVPASLRLSLERIQRVVTADGETTGVTPRPREGAMPQSGAPGGVPAVAAPTPDPKATFRLGDPREFKRELDLLVERAIGAFEVRLRALATEIEELGSTNRQHLGEISALRAEVEGLQHDQARLQGSLSVSREEAKRALDELADKTRKMDEYSRRYDAAVAEASTAAAEAEAKAKRGFVDKQLSTIQTIRDCLDELLRTHGTQRPVRQAATNLNNLLRFLVHGKYMGAEGIAALPIPRIEGNSE